MYNNVKKYEKYIHTFLLSIVENYDLQDIGDF